MRTPIFPGKRYIKRTLKKVNAKLKIKELDDEFNFAVKEGFLECKRLIEERLKNPKNDYFIPETEEEIGKRDIIYRKQLEPIRKLKTERGRSIAIMCVDWMNGEHQAIGFLKAYKKVSWWMRFFKWAVAAARFSKK